MAVKTIEDNFNDQYGWILYMIFVVFSSISPPECLYFQGLFIHWWLFPSQNSQSKCASKQVNCFPRCLLELKLEMDPREQISQYVQMGWTCDRESRPFTCFILSKLFVSQKKKMKNCSKETATEMSLLEQYFWSVITLCSEQIN